MRGIGIFTRSAIFGAALSLAAGLLAGAAHAADVEIKAPWTRATARGAVVGAGYLAIVNKGAAADRLVSAASDAAAKVEIHEMAVKDGVMTMRAAPDGVEIKPGETVTLKPGGLHLMMMGLKQPLVQGATVNVTLTFAKAGAIAVVLPVEALGAMTPPTAAH